MRECVRECVGECERVCESESESESERETSVVFGTFCGPPLCSPLLFLSNIVTRSF